MDISDLSENMEDDYYLSSFFPAKVETHLQPLIEHRVKLLLKHSIVFHAGESHNVETSCILDHTNLSLTLKSYEHLPVTFESEGSIKTRFKGRIKVNLTNYTCQPIRMSVGCVVGYIVLQPFSLK